MAEEKVSIRPTNIFVATVRVKKGKKSGSGVYYFPITREMREQLHFEEGENVTLGILKREGFITKTEIPQAGLSN